MSDDPDRLGRLGDLTRWNRAGLPRFVYVDGDAATWLEELRIATMGLVARGAPLPERLPETWRHRFSDDPEQWPDATERAAFVDALAWKTLARPFPDRSETARRRNARLLDQYAARTTDHGWETMRATARAAHVLLGHLDAYANEGYLRTATQWDNLARLAAMVNHQPAPPTSATTTVGLILDPTDDGAALEITRGLAMKYTPPEGGGPVVFETLAPLKAHAALNAVRATGWARDPNPLAGADHWGDDGKADLAPGAVAALSRSGVATVRGVTAIDVTRDAVAGSARIAFTAVPAGWARGDSTLHVDPGDVRRGLPRSTTGVLVLKLDSAASHPVDAAVKLHHAGGSTRVRVVGNADGHLKLASSLELAHGTSVTVETLVPVSDVGGGLIAPKAIGPTVWYLDTSGVIAEGTGKAVFASAEDDDAIIGYDFSGTVGALGSFYAETQGARREAATVVGTPPPVVPGQDFPGRIVSFAGKPPKGLAIGDVMVLRPSGGGTTLGLRIVGVATAGDSYALQFDTDLPDPPASFLPDAHEFHGPMRRRLRPVDHDRNPLPAFAGPEIVVADPTDAARELVRLGRVALIEDERGGVPPVRAVLVEAVEASAGLRLLFEPAEGLGGFAKGWTVVNLNAVVASHGETRSPKTLGSGDAERESQAFPFSAKDVSFVPSSVAETGVAPDMEITVDGLLWSYRDLIDPLADGTESWSVSLTEDGAMAVRFRRRLPSGTNNVVVRRYRTGVGPAGAVPAASFDKPMRKHRHVRAITQPFASSGGAGREPLEDIRVNAPSRLAANGRAVALKDFERLCRRRSDVWQARARLATSPAAAAQVAIVVVPANGGGIGPTLRADLVAFVEDRALPGTGVAIEDHASVRLILEATVRVAVEAFDRTEVRAAAQAALVETFSLRNRRLGQALYISEVAAALERVTGVETAVVRTFALAPGAVIVRTAMLDGKSTAFFPFDNQVISVDPLTAGADVAVAVEAL